MGIANRHSSAPFIDGERLSATDLELDVSAIYEQFGGQTEDVNVVPGAAIQGSKLLAGSVSGSRLASSSLLASHIGAGSVTEAKFEDGAVESSHLSQIASEAISEADQDINTTLLTQLGNIATETTHCTVAFTASTETHVVLLFASAIFDCTQTNLVVFAAEDKWRIKRDAATIVQKRHLTADNFLNSRSFGGPDWKDWVSLIGVDVAPSIGVPVSYTLTSQHDPGSVQYTFRYQESMLTVVGLRR